MFRAATRRAALNITNAPVSRAFFSTRLDRVLELAGVAEPATLFCFFLSSPVSLLRLLSLRGYALAKHRSKRHSNVSVDLATYISPERADDLASISNLLERVESVHAATIPREHAGRTPIEPRWHRRATAKTTSS